MKNINEFRNYIKTKQRQFMEFWAKIKISKLIIIESDLIIITQKDTLA